MALRPDHESTFACSLEKEQALLLQTVAPTFNSTCIFNVSIGASGVVQW